MATTACVQRLTLALEGVTAGDYMSWLRDPEPIALGCDLRSVTVRADSLSQRIDLELTWDRPLPGPEEAVAAAGFPLTPEVIDVRDTSNGST